MSKRKTSDLIMLNEDSELANINNDNIENNIININKDNTNQNNAVPLKNNNIQLKSSLKTSPRPSFNHVNNSTNSSGVVSKFQTEDIENNIKKTETKVDDKISNAVTNNKHNNTFNLQQKFVEQKKAQESISILNILKNAKQDTQGNVVVTNIENIQKPEIITKGNNSKDKININNYSFNDNQNLLVNHTKTLKNSHTINKNQISNNSGQNNSLNTSSNNKAFSNNNILQHAINKTNTLKNKTKYSPLKDPIYVANMESDMYDDINIINTNYKKNMIINTKLSNLNIESDNDMDDGEDMKNSHHNSKYNSDTKQQPVTLFDDIIKQKNDLKRLSYLDNEYNYSKKHDLYNKNIESQEKNKEEEDKFTPKVHKSNIFKKWLEYHIKDIDEE